MRKDDTALWERSYRFFFFFFFTIMLSWHAHHVIASSRCQTSAKPERGVPPPSSLPPARGTVVGMRSTSAPGDSPGDSARVVMLSRRASRARARARTGARPRAPTRRPSVRGEIRTHPTRAPCGGARVQRGAPLHSKASAPSSPVETRGPCSRRGPVPTSPPSRTPPFPLHSAAVGVRKNKRARNPPRFEPPAFSPPPCAHKRFLSKARLRVRRVPSCTLGVHPAG